MRGTVLSTDGRLPELGAGDSHRVAESLGFRPAARTITLRLDDYAPDELRPRQVVDGIELRLVACSLDGVRCVLVRSPQSQASGPTHEAVTPVPIATCFGLAEGDSIPIFPPDDCWSPSGLPMAVRFTNEFDAVVFDLDGTVAELDVEWLRVGDEVAREIGPALDRPVADYRMDELVTVADEVGKRDRVEAIFTAAEIDGVRTAKPRDLLWSLGTLSGPVGVCTSNSADAAEMLLDQFDVRDHVDAIVGREHVERYKPDSQPLTRCLERLDAEAGNALFVGDRRTDAEAAARAGTSFLHPNRLLAPGGGGR